MLPRRVRSSLPRRGSRGTKRVDRGSVGKSPAKLLAHHLHSPLPAHVLVDLLQSTCITRSQRLQVVKSAKHLVSKNHRQLLPNSLNSWTSLKSQDLVDNGWWLVNATWIGLRLVDPLLLLLQRFGSLGWVRHGRLRQRRWLAWSHRLNHRWLNIHWLLNSLQRHFTIIWWLRLLVDLDHLL